MHQVHIPDHIIARAIERRGCLHPFENLDPRRTALVVVDLQNGFMAPGQPAEIANARDIVPNVNRIAAALRKAGGRVVFIQNTYGPDIASAWSVYHDHFGHGPHRDRMVQAFTRGSYGHALWPGLEVMAEDLKVEKSRFGAFVEGSSGLHATLQGLGLDTLIVVGTATNVCCESTARDAMMMNYKVVFVSDANACRTDEEHNATLAALVVLFADVMSTEEVVAAIGRGAALPAAAE